MRPLVIIGNPNSVFVKSMAGYWSARGIATVIVTANHWQGGATNADGVPVVTAEGALTPQARAMLEMLLPVMGDLERELHQATPDRIRSARRSWAGEAQAPSLLPPLVDGVLIAEAVRSLNPSGVLGQEAFAYGLATALCEGYRRTLWLWGGDVMQFCNTSDTAQRLMRLVLHRVPYLVMGSLAVQERVIDQFGVDANKALVIKLGIDTALYARATDQRRRDLFTKYRIPEHSKVVLNARRLREHWGSETAIEVLLRAASAREDVFAICLGGSGTQATAALARQRAEAAGVASRFVAIDGDIDEPEFADLVGVSDVFLSLTQDDEPLSLSVLQGAAAGGAPVIGDQQTYRDACATGLDAVLVPHGDATEICAKVLDLLQSPDRQTAIATNNRHYIVTEQNRDRHMERLLRIVIGGVAVDHLLATAV